MPKEKLSAYRMGWMLVMFDLPVLTKKQLGKMTALRVGPQYEEDRARFAEVLQQHQRKIVKAVDLFSRIKNTEQAEEMFTVFFASRVLKKAHPQKQIAEQDIYQYIITDWKKTWATEEKKNAVADAIRNLVVLGWMKLQYSDTIPELA